MLSFLLESLIFEMFGIINMASVSREENMKA